MSYNRKYFLHSQVRKIGVQLLSREKTINVTESLAKLAQKNNSIAELRDKYNYSVQFINPMMTI